MYFIYLTFLHIIIVLYFFAKHFVTLLLKRYLAEILLIAIVNMIVYDHLHILSIKKSEIFLVIFLSPSFDVYIVK